jgi:transcriptional regulator of nitric oxide reductase
MAVEESKNLWGKEFRIVKEGLAETDVVIFVQKLMADQRKAQKKLDQLDSLHELATKTIQDAERLAQGLKREAEAQGQARAVTIIAEAEAKAKDIVAEAQRKTEAAVEAGRQRGAALEAESRRKVLLRMGQIEAALREASDAATKEMAGRMSTHYIGKYLHQSVHFLAAFEKLVREAQRDLAVEDKETTPAARGPQRPGPSPSGD